MPQGYNSIQTHARISARKPEALSTCDCCGFVYQRNALKWEMQWMGMQLQRTGFLYCPKCLDQPNEQLRTIIIPPDPIPIIDPRPEPYSTEVTGWIITQDGQALLDQSGSALLTQSLLTPEEIAGPASADGDQNNAIVMQNGGFILQQDDSLILLE